MFSAPLTIDIITMLHVLAVVLGLGGATYSDILLFRFLNDLKISKKEAEVIHTLATFILGGIIFAFVTGAWLFFADMERLMYSTKFLAKITILIVIMINGLMLHKYALKHLEKIHFSPNPFKNKKYVRYRRLAFGMGGISVVSWYTVFALASIDILTQVPYLLLMLIYLFLLCCAILGSQFFERLLEYSARRTSRKF